MGTTRQSEKLPAVESGTELPSQQDDDAFNQRALEAWEGEGGFVPPFNEDKKNTDLE